MSTREDVDAAMAALRRAVPGYNPAVDADTVDLWTVALTRFPADALVAATGRWVSTEPRFPALAEFVAVVRRMADEMAGPALLCPGCPETPGLVEDPSGWRPCRECNRKGWERWASGGCAPVIDTPKGPVPMRELMSGSIHTAKEKSA